MFLSQVRKTNPAGIDKAKERRSSYWLGSTSGTCRRSRTAAPPSTTRPLHHCLGSPRSGRETSPRTPGPLTRRSAESPPPPPPPPAPPRWTFLLLHRRADWSNCSDGCYSPSLPACRFSALGNNLSLWTLSLKGLLADHTNSQKSVCLTLLRHKGHLKQLFRIYDPSSFFWSSLKGRWPQKDWRSH